MPISASGRSPAKALREELLAKIQERGGIDEPSPANNRTLLLDAVIRRDIPAALALLRLGANPNIPDETGRGPLLYAAGTGYREPPTLLATAGLTPERRLVNALLLAGADPNANSDRSDRLSPLQACLEPRLRWCARALIRSGGDLDSLSPADQDRATLAAGLPLDALRKLSCPPPASRSLSLEAAKPFIDKVERLNLAQREASKRARAESEKALREQTELESERARLAAKSTPVKIRTRPGAQQTSASTPPLSPQTPSGALSAQELIKSFGGIDARDPLGRTPLLTAIIRHEVSLAIDLLELGANPNIPDKAGRGPLLYAAGTSYQKHKEADDKAAHYGESAKLNLDAKTPSRHLVLALLAAGGNPNQEPSEDQSLSPLSGALFYGNVWGAVALIRAGARIEDLNEGSKRSLNRLRGESLSAFEEMVFRISDSKPLPKLARKTPSL